MTTRNCTTAAAAAVVMIKHFVGSIQRQMAKHPYVSTALVVLAINLISRFVKSGQFSNYQQYSSQPYPTSFFSLESPVIDYPYGNVADVSEILLEEETMFVMFYAPWCARSLKLKHEFEKAAKFFENEVLFVSINCWHRLSTCRQQNIFMSFPVFYFYVLGQEGFRYNGVTRADFMVEFILRMLHPLTYISSQEKLTEFMSSHDTSTVGYFGMTSTSPPPPPPAFNQFYSAALHTYEKDPKNVIPFGVLTDARLAEQLKIMDPPSVALIRSLNDSLRFPIDENFTASALSTWTLATRQQPVVKWIFPSGSKSLVLSLDIRRGPAAVLFLPATPLASRNYYTALLRQIGLMYYNCNRSSIVNGMVTTDVYSVAKNFLRRQVLEKLCHQTSYVNTWLTTTRKTVPLKSCCMTTKDSMCQYCLHFHNSHPSSAKDCSKILLPSFVPSFPSECTETMVNYNPSEFASYCCNYLHRQHRGARQPTRSKWVVTETVLTDEEDAFEEHFAEKRRGRRRLETQCLALQKSKSLGWNTVDGGDHDLHDLQLLSQNDFSQDFVGLGCRTNQTIRFFAMDSAHSDMFMESLGIDTRPEIDKLTMVLYHFKNELIHVMKSRFQPQNIVNFIKNFTVGSLPAFRRAAKDRPSSVELCADQTHICVIEVTSKSFRKIVLNNNKDVLLLYYTPWCGFCLGFSHVFLTLAYQFRSVPSIVFARINCDANDLPWQYMATEYPTLILYPAHSKSDSVLFPPHQPKTLPNLVRFVLRSSSNLLLLDSSLSVCSRDCISTTRNLSAVRMEALFHEMESTSLEMSSALSHRRRLEVEIGEVASTGSERLELLENKLKHVLSLERLLGKKLFELRLRLNSVQYLHGVLQSYTEPHLDTNTLLSIAQHNTMYKSRLKNYELL